jgi:[protein-PII] uridylyltransferase
MVAARDRVGLLAVVSGVLSRHGLDIHRALVATWLDGAAVEVFEVRGDEAPDPEVLAASFAEAFDAPITSDPLAGARIRFDDRASPWHTICEVEAPDRPGLLHHLATAFAAAGVTVVAATIGERGEDAVDTFELVTSAGEKLGEVERRAVRVAITGGAELVRRRFRGGLVAR